MTSTTVAACRARQLSRGAAVAAVGAAFAVDAADRARSGSLTSPSEALALLSSAAGTLACVWLLAASGACWAARRGGAAGELGRALALALAPDALRPVLTVVLGAALLAPLAGARPAGGSDHAPVARLLAAVAPPAAGDVPRPIPPWPDPAFGARGEPVQVRPGDTLWELSAARLGPDASAGQICVEWPRWFHANRAAIEDPDLIYPGQHLTPPAPIIHDRPPTHDRPVHP